MRLSLGVAFLLFSPLALVHAQPPTGPDAQPRAIAPDELNKIIGGPTLISLKVKDERPEKVLAAICEQMGSRLVSSPLVDIYAKLPTVTVDIDQEPCLVALRKVCAPLGLNFLFTADYPNPLSKAGLALRVLPADDPQLRMEGPMLVRGPFVVIATSVQRARTISLSEPVKDRPTAFRDDYWVDFVILADPKLRKHGFVGIPMLSGADEWTIRAAETGDTLVKRLNTWGAPAMEWRFTAHRRIAPLNAPNVPAFKATAQRMFVTTKSEVWKVDDILKAKNVSREVTLAEGKRKYTIQNVLDAPNTSFPRKGEMFAVRLGVSGVGITKGRWSGWPEPTAAQLFESFRLVDGDGIDYTPFGALKHQGFGFAPKDLTLDGTFWSGRQRGVGKAAAGRPVQALWTLPTEIRSIEIPLAFDKLPLP